VRLQRLGGKPRTIPDCMGTGCAYRAPGLKTRARVSFECVLMSVLRRDVR
jgi:hypothetical protein